MSERYYVVVGNDYKEFADQPDVFTVTQFYEHMQQRGDWPETDASIVIGQGIGMRDREFIHGCLKEKSIGRLHAIAPLASLDETHKHSEENVLITAPQKLGKGQYGFGLAITDKVDRLSDHVTGRHVGAMLLMEAARQATIAVLDHEYNEGAEQPFGLILDRFDSQFSGFLFPLPATLHTVIEEKRVASKNISVAVVTTVTQCGAEIGVLTLDVTLCGKPLLGKLEDKKAQSAIRQLRSVHAASAERQPSLG